MPFGARDREPCLKGRLTTSGAGLSMEIIRALLTASLNTRSPMPGTDAVSSVLKRASSKTWEKVLDELGRHKVLPLIGYTIAKSDLQEAIPDNAVKIRMAS